MGHYKAQDQEHFDIKADPIREWKRLGIESLLIETINTKYLFCRNNNNNKFIKAACT